MRTKLVYLSLPASLLIGTAGHAEEMPWSIVGVVRYTGTVPPAEKILAIDGRTILHSDLVVEPKTKGLRYVLALLENAPVQPKIDESRHRAQGARLAGI